MEKKKLTPKQAMKVNARLGAAADLWVSEEMPSGAKWIFVPIAGNGWNERCMTGG